MVGNVRNDWKWLLGFAIISLLLVGFMTDFTFRDLEFQFHDTYFVIDSRNGFLFIVAFLYIPVGFYRLIDLGIESNRIFALLVAIINPIAVLLMVIALYFGINYFLEMRQLYPDADYLGRLVPVLFLLMLIVIQIVVEIKSLKKIKLFF
jgi:hypothetical protein